MKTKHSLLQIAPWLPLSGIACRVVVTAAAQTTAFDADAGADRGGLVPAGECVFTGEGSWQRNTVDACSLSAGFSTGFVFAGEEVNLARPSYQLCSGLPAEPAVEAFADEDLRSVTILFYEDLVKADPFSAPAVSSAASAPVPAGRDGRPRLSPPAVISRGRPVGLPTILSVGSSTVIPTPHPEPPTGTFITDAGADR